MKRLSKDAATLFHALYTEFLARRKVGQPKSEARMFDSAESIKNDFVPQMLLADVNDAMRELSKAGYLNNDYGSDTITVCELTDGAIADCEKIIGDKILAAADFISKFIP